MIAITSSVNAPIIAVAAPHERRRRVAAARRPTVIGEDDDSASRTSARTESSAGGTRPLSTRATSALPRAGANDDAAAVSAADGRAPTPWGNADEGATARISATGPEGVAGIGTVGIGTVGIGTVGIGAVGGGKPSIVLGNGDAD